MIKKLNKKKQIKYLLYIEDTLINDSMVNVIVETVQDDYPNTEIKLETISLCCEKDHSVPLIEKITRAAELADIITFDYGGLEALGCYGLVNSWNRYFIRLIDEHPNKDWRCFSALNTFEQPDRKKLEELGVNFKW